MFRIVGFHFSMAIKAQGYAIFIRIFASLGNLLDMVQFYFEATELMTYTAVSATIKKCSFCYFGWERQMFPPNV